MNIKHSQIKKELRRRQLDRMEDKAMFYFLGIFAVAAIFIFGGNLLGYFF